MYISQVSFFLELQQGFCLKYIVCLPSSVNPRIPTGFLSQILCVFPNFCLSQNYNVFVSNTMYTSHDLFILELQQRFCLKYNVYLPSFVFPRTTTRFLSQIHCVFPNFCLSQNHNNVFVSNTMYTSHDLFILELQQRVCLKYYVYFPSFVYPRISTRFCLKYNVYFPRFLS